MKAAAQRTNAALLASAVLLVNVVLSASAALLASMAPLAGASSAPTGSDGRAFFAARGSISAPIHKSYERRAYYVPMSDGVRLAITVYTPSGGSELQRFPVLLWYLPGHRESIDLKTGQITSAYAASDLEYFTSRGYALAAAEMRGSGASFGSRELDRSPQIGRDGKQLVDWIASQPWSNGAVGMVGASYQGFSQYATAAERPAALRAIFPEIAGFDDYTSMFHPGGIANIALSEFASASIVRDDLNYYEPAASRPRLPSVPVIDEDADGELTDEIPIDQNGNGNFLDDGEPRYADGQPRQHQYYRATRDHLANATLTVAALAAAPFRDSKVGGTKYDYRDIDPADRAQRIAASGIATYHRGGWFDYHARDTVIWHATLSGHTPTHLMMAPSAHGGFPADSDAAPERAGPYFQHFGDTTTALTALNREKLLFFDRYLRGIDNGFERLPPVLIYVMGHGWRAEREWPLARQRLTDYNFDANGSLLAQPVARGLDRHRVDLSADARSAGANRWNYHLSAARAPLSLDATRQQRIQYTSAALVSDVEVTGHPVLQLHLSSDAANGDIHAYLEDVAPDGSSLLVSEGQLRANFPKVLPVQEMIAASAKVLKLRPELPWHGYRAADYVPDVFANGQIRELSLDLMPTSWVFKAGHRIRISLAGADHPTFALHPSLASSARPTWSIRRGPARSRLTLPVIP